MIHVIEGWWSGCEARGADARWSVTDAAASWCAAAMRAQPGDVAVVLGPRHAAERVAAFGVRVAAWVCPPVQSPVLARRALGRTLDELRDRAAVSGAPFAEAVTAWTPGAVLACEGLDTTVVDGLTAIPWNAPYAGRERAEARGLILDLAGVEPAASGETLVIAVPFDPPESAEILLPTYGVGIAEKARAFGNRRAVIAVPEGVRDWDRGSDVFELVGHETRFVETTEPVGLLLAGADLVIVCPLAEACADRPHLIAARSWWGVQAGRAGVGAGIKLVGGPGDDWVGASDIRLGSWSRAELARGVAAAAGGLS